MESGHAWIQDSLLPFKLNCVKVFYMILSRAIYSLLGLLMGVVLYMIYYQDIPAWRWGILPLVLLGILTYIFSSELNHYWLNRFPVEIDEREHYFLANHHPFYHSLSHIKQKEFGRACIVFHRKRDYILQGIPNFPDDLKVLWSGQAVFLSHIFDMTLEKWNHYEKVVLYPHPFMTPKIETVHASETNFEEGVLLFSVDQLIPGMTQYHRFFNIGLYEFVRIAKKIKPGAFSTLNQYDKSELIEIAKRFSNIEYDAIRYWINIEILDVEAIYITLLLSNYKIWSTFSESQINQLPMAGKIIKDIRSQFTLDKTNSEPLP